MFNNQIDIVMDEKHTGSDKLTGSSGRQFSEKTTGIRVQINMILFASNQ